MTSGVILGLIFFSIMAIALAVLFGLVVVTLVKQKDTKMWLLLSIICLALLNWIIQLLMIIYTVIRSTS